MRLIDADELAVESIDITDLPTDHGLMVYRAEEVDDAPTVNAIVIPINATNGDVIKSVTDEDYWETVDDDGTHYITDVWCNKFDVEWWNAPCKKG